MTNVSKRKTLYFHIGTHKTGTTYIQELMRQNKEKLREQKIEYQGKCTSTK